MTRTRFFKKTMAAVLAFAFVFSAMPIHALAGTIDDLSPAYEDNAGYKQVVPPISLPETETKATSPAALEVQPLEIVAAHDSGISFVPAHFPFFYKAYAGQENLVFMQYVSAESNDEPGENASSADTYGSNHDIAAEPYENDSTLYWYLDGERRMYAGRVTIGESPVLVELRFEEVTEDDMGVWTLRAYSHGMYDESPYALFLQVGEFESVLGVNQSAFSGLQINGAGAYTTVATFQAALQAALDGGDAEVRVTGELTGATEQLTIDIPANRTLIWEASYSGEVSGGMRFSSGNLLHFPGRQSVRPGTSDRMGLGTLIIAEGANIVNTGTGIALHTAASAATMTGGTITSNGPSLAYTDNAPGGLLTITGGALASAEDAALVITGTGNSVHIFGGTFVGVGSSNFIGSAPVFSPGAIVMLNGSTITTLFVRTGQGGATIINPNNPDDRIHFHRFSVGNVFINYEGTGGPYEIGTNTNITHQLNPNSMNNPTFTSSWEIVGGRFGLLYTMIEGIGTRHNVFIPLLDATDTPPPIDVTAVNVTPATVTLSPGGTQTFGTVVDGANAPQGVTWTVEGGVTGTTISASGVLTIAAGETTTTLTVRATSTADGFTNISGTATVTVEQPTFGNGTSPPDGNDRDRDSGRGGGIVGAITGLLTPANAPVNITQAAFISAVNDAIAAAQAAGSTVATVNIRNPGNISLDILRYITNSGMAQGFTKRIHADSMNATNTAVDVRITLNPAQSTQNLNLSASTTNNQAQNATQLFNRFFSNNVMTVALGHQGSFGQEVRVAARVPANLNTNNLVIYSYDRAANTFRQLPAPNVFVDTNGYVHFNTTLGGEIVISDGVLARR